jgi:4-hydroxy-2-oxoglutarate aldolase
MQPVVCGSMGEAFHLTPEERVTLFSAARQALDLAGLTETILICGT